MRLDGGVMRCLGGNDFVSEFDTLMHIYRLEYRYILKYDSIIPLSSQRRNGTDCIAGSGQVAY